MESASGMFVKSGPPRAPSDLQSASYPKRKRKDGGSPPFAGWGGRSDKCNGFAGESV
jgi:hypothetical protein